MKPSSSPEDSSVAGEAEVKAQTSSPSSPRRSSASSVDSLWQSSGYSSSSAANGTQNKAPSSSTDKPATGKAKAAPRRKTKPGSHSKKKDADHVPRPRNAFILFRCHAVANNLIPPTLETDHRNISRIVSHMWNSLPEQDRAVWQREAQKEKERHAILYPEYKYQPLYRKPATLKRNIPAPENTAEQCEKAADMILKMYGENSGLKVKGAEEGRLLSASARRKIERRELAEQRLALRKANPPSTGRKRTTSSNSTASKRPNTASSQAGASRSGVSRSSIASSTGASSVSSHLSDFGSHSSLHEGPQPSVLAGSHSMVGIRDGRRSSSVPPLEDNYRGFGHFGHDSRPGMPPHHPSDGHISSSWHANLSIDPDLARHSPPLPLHGSAWGVQPLAASPMMDDMQTPRRSTMRKPPPPPLFSEDGNSAAFAPASAYVPYTPGSSMHHVPPPSGIYEPPQWLQLRRRTIESATPRTTLFNIPPTPRAAQHRPLPGHLMSNDVALVSPLRSSFAEARRTSVAWHNWSRMSQLDSAGASPSASGARWRHSAAGDIIASAAVQEAYPASGGGLVTPTMFGMMMQQQQHTPQEHHGIPNSAAAAQHRHASHEDVFTFGPNFIVDAQSDTDVRPGTSTAASEASPAAPASVDGSSGPPSLIDSTRIQQGSFTSSSDMMGLHEDLGQHSSSRMTDDEPREELMDDLPQQDVYMTGTEDSPLKDDRGRGKSPFAWSGQDGSLAADISNRLFSRWSQRPSTGGVNNMSNGSSSSLPEDMPTLHRFNSLPPSYETASAPSSVDAHSSGYSSHQMTPSSTVVVTGEVHQEQESQQLQAHSPAYATDISHQHIATEPTGMATGYDGMPLNSTPMSSEQTAREWQVYGTGESGRPAGSRHSRLDATLVDALQQQLSPESSTGDSFIQDVISPLSERFSGAAQHPRSFGAFVGSSSAPSTATMFSAPDHLQHQQHDQQQLQAAHYRQHQDEAMVHDTRFASASPTVNTNNLVTSPMGFQDEGYLYVNPSSTTGPVSSPPPSHNFPTSTHSTPSANRTSNRRRRGPIHSASSSAIPTTSTTRGGKKREKTPGSPTATRGSGRFVQMSMVPLSAGPRRVEHFHEPKP